MRPVASDYATGFQFVDCRLEPNPKIHARTRRRRGMTKGGVLIESEHSRHCGCHTTSGFHFFALRVTIEHPRQNFVAHVAQGNRIRDASEPLLRYV